jgi:hypothetical protein
LELADACLRLTAQFKHFVVLRSLVPGLVDVQYLQQDPVVFDVFLLGHEFQDACLDIGVETEHVHVLVQSDFYLLNDVDVTFVNCIVD